MLRLFRTPQEPRGSSVIQSASGPATHVSAPRGEAYLSKVGGGGALHRASEARRRAFSHLNRPDTGRL